MEVNQEILNLKSIVAEMNVLSRSDGSVIITQGMILSIYVMFLLIYVEFFKFKVIHRVLLMLMDQQKLYQWLIWT